MLFILWAGACLLCDQVALFPGLHFLGKMWRAKGDGASERTLKSQYCSNCQMQCSAASFWISLTIWGSCGLWESSGVCGCFPFGNADPRASAALLLYLFCCHWDWLQCIFLYRLCRFLWGLLLALGRYGGCEEVALLGGLGRQLDSVTHLFCLVMAVAKTKTSIICARFLSCSPHWSLGSAVWNMLIT